MRIFKIKNKIEKSKILIVKIFEKKIIDIVKNISKFEIKQTQLKALNIALKKIIVIAKTKFEKICYIR